MPVSLRSLGGYSKEGTDQGTVPYPLFTALGTRSKLFPNTALQMTSCNSNNNKNNNKIMNNLNVTTDNSTTINYIDRPILTTTATV